MRAYYLLRNHTLLSKGLGSWHQAMHESTGRLPVASSTETTDVGGHQDKIWAIGLAVACGAI